MGYTDVPGEVDPFEVLDIPSQLSFDGIPPPASFVKSGDPAFYLSEPNVSRFLARFVVQRNLKTIVELGCFVGWTTAHLALAADHLGGDAHVNAVDISDKNVRQAEANVSGLRGSARVSFSCADSCSPTLLGRLPGEIDLVFIDSSHEYDFTLREIANYGPRLSPRGCIALHDSLSFGAVRRAIREVGQSYRRFTFATERSNGLTILIPRRG